MHTRRGLFFALLSLVAFISQAQALDVGDPAPPLRISEWVKGEPVSLGDGQNIYVIELWATWCKPCRENMPHLTALQAKHQSKGVIFLGLSDEPADEVRPFVKRHDGEMGYRVATDDSGETKKLYAAQTPGFVGIPFAIVVDRQGKIAWYSNDIKKLDATIDAMLDGSYDTAAFKESMSASAIFTEYFNFIKAHDDEGAKEAGERFLLAAAKDPQLLVRFSSRILYTIGINNAFSTDKLTQDKALALRVAEAAYQASKGKDLVITSVYAELLFEKGDLDQAIKYEEEALGLVKNKKQKRSVKRTLRQYKRAKKKAA